jgi:hypothetical protein
MSSLDTYLPPLHEACRGGDLTEVQRLVESKTTDINQEAGPAQDTPLHIAVRAGNTKIAALLLKAGADKNQMNLNFFSPMGEAAYNMTSFKDPSPNPYLPMAELLANHHKYVPIEELLENYLQSSPIEGLPRNQVRREADLKEEESKAPSRQGIGSPSPAHLLYKRGASPISSAAQKIQKLVLSHPFERAPKEEWLHLLEKIKMPELEKLLDWLIINNHFDKFEKLLKDEEEDLQPWWSDRCHVLIDWAVLRGYMPIVWSVFENAGIDPKRKYELLKLAIENNHSDVVWAFLIPGKTTPSEELLTLAREYGNEEIISFLSEALAMRRDAAVMAETKNRAALAAMTAALTRAASLGPYKKLYESLDAL